jgi:hypothetical protein
LENFVERLGKVVERLGIVGTQPKNVRKSSRDKHLEATKRDVVRNNIHKTIVKELE